MPDFHLQQLSNFVKPSLCLLVDGHEYEFDCYFSQPQEQYFSGEEEDNEPGQVVPAHTVVNPEAVMVVLLYADAADCAVVFPGQHRPHAPHTQLGQSFLVAVVLVSPQRNGASRCDYQRQEQSQSHQHHPRLQKQSNTTERLQKHEDNGSEQQSQYEEEEWLKTAAVAGSIPHLGSADNLQVVQKRVAVVQHLPDAVELVLLGDLQGRLSLVVLETAVSPRHQQLLHDFDVAVGGAEVEGGLSGLVAQVDLDVGLGEQVLCDLFAGGVGCPVEGSAEFGVLGVEVEPPIVQIQHGVGTISLRSHVQQRHFERALLLQSGFVFVKEAEYGDIAPVGGEVCGGVSFCVGLVEQQFGAGLDVREPHVLVFQILAIVLDVVVEDGELVVMGAVVDHCVFGGVADRQQLQRLLLVLQEQLDLLQLPRREHELLLVFILRHQIIICSQRSWTIYKLLTLFLVNKGRGEQVQANNKAAGRAGRGAGVGGKGVLEATNGNQQLKS